MAFLLFVLLGVVGQSPVDFDQEVIPVLTKAGCNTGACHGAAVGRGGFKLSLYGGDPTFDFESIVHELEGRRVNLASPDESLFVLKPTESIDHGGGYRLEVDGHNADTLRRWIAEGARRQDSISVERLQVSPGRVILKAPGDTFELKAVAHLENGSKTDVTAKTVFTAEDPAAVEIDPVSALTEVKRRGRHIVIARYLQHTVAIEVILPLSESPINPTGQKQVNYIDGHVLATLQTLRIPVSSQADDETFFRRLSLDLTGRLPMPRDAVAYRNDQRKGKRSHWIDRMIDSDAFNEYWTLQLAKLLRIRSQPTESAGAETYHAWLRSKIETDTPYDQLARELILATGDTHQIGPANFYRTVGGPREQAEFTSELFMANRLRCANCHNHPLDRWTQDDYHGLAAIFAKVKRGRVIDISDRGDVIHPRTGENAIQRIPGEQFVASDEDGREALAGWLTDSSNPYFAKAIVNRLWKAMMGRGLVEPSDDLRATNPATHPPLLDELARDFVDHDYSLKHIVRRIANSQTYSRSAEVLDGNTADDRYYSHALVRPLPPEVLADAIADVTGVSQRYGNEPLGTRAVSLVDPKTPSEALDILGRCSREDTCEVPAGTQAGGMSLQLHLLNGKLLNRKIADPKGRLAKLLADQKLPIDIVKTFYETALSRTATDEELAYWNEQLVGRDEAAIRQTLEDFVWGLLTCREFSTNH